MDACRPFEAIVLLEEEKEGAGFTFLMLEVAKETIANKAKELGVTQELLWSIRAHMSPTRHVWQLEVCGYEKWPEVVPLRFGSDVAYTFKMREDA